MKQKLYWAKALASFFLVLFMMPLGHALMIIMEHTLSPGVLHYSSFAMGVAFAHGRSFGLCKWRYATDFVGAVRWNVLLDRLGGIPLHVFRQSLWNSAATRPNHRRSSYKARIPDSSCNIRHVDDDNANVYLLLPHRL